MAVKILIADDGKLNRVVLNKLLEPYGRCDMAEDGIAAIKRVVNAFHEKQPYDLIFLDMMMPGLNGDEVRDKIRSLESSEGVKASKIILVTGIDQTHEELEKRLQDYEEIIAKPVNDEDIKHIMERFGY
ncbi:MAG: response regulator [Deltaproteobacteria bacterium]|nr:response regulator [Deltaproteobacteria bacterium]